MLPAVVFALVVAASVASTIHGVSITIRFVSSLPGHVFMLISVFFQHLLVHCCCICSAKHFRRHIRRIALSMCVCLVCCAVVMLPCQTPHCPVHVSASAAAAAAVHALDNLALHSTTQHNTRDSHDRSKMHAIGYLLQLTLGHATDAVCAVCGVARLDAGQTAQVLIAFLQCVSTSMSVYVLVSIAQIHTFLHLPISAWSAMPSLTQKSYSSVYACMHGINSAISMNGYTWRHLC